MLPATKPQLSGLGEGVRGTHWYWVSGDPDQTLEEETMGLRPLILSCTLLLHIESGRAQARGIDHVMRFLPVSQAAKLRPGSIRKLATRQERVSDMRLRTGSPDSQFVAFLGYEKKQKSKPLALCHLVAGCSHSTPVSGLLHTPFVSPLSVVPSCKLMLTHKCLVKAGFSRWAIFL